MRLMSVVASSIVAMVISSPAVFAAESYNVDPVHSTSMFRIKHANTAWFYGRFNEPTGSFTLDEKDPTKSSFAIEIFADKVDTANAQRDAHLKGPDFFNAKQHPKITFKSTAVAKGKEDGMLEVTGDLTMHGVTKQIKIPVEMTGKGEFPAGTHRAGVEARIKVKMSDFEIKGVPGMPNALSDEVTIMVSLEGIKQK